MTAPGIPRRTALTLLGAAPFGVVAPSCQAAVYEPLFVGFHVWWDPASAESLAANIGRLNVIAPFWISLEGSGGRFTQADDPAGLAALAGAKTVPMVYPCVHNAQGGAFDGAKADRLLADPVARAALIAGLRDLARRRGYGGYVFDFENLSPASVAAYPRFLAEARAGLGGREVWVCAMFGDHGWPMRALQAATDALVLMAYDQHWMTGSPGPVSGLEWFKGLLARRFAELDPAKVIVALGDYGYDWTEADASGPLAGAPMTFTEAQALAGRMGVRPARDPASGNARFSYTAPDGRTHQVWYLDAQMVEAQIRAAAPSRPRGYALWRLGGEDPALWRIFDRRNSF